MRLIEPDNPVAIVSTRPEPDNYTAVALGGGGYEPEWQAECIAVARRLGIHPGENLGRFADAYIALSWLHPLGGLLCQRMIIWITVNRAANVGKVQVSLHGPGLDTRADVSTYAAWKESEPTAALQRWWRDRLREVEVVVRGLPAMARAGAPETPALP